ncbi:hypothetical protein PF004_g3834 [Phytophthora fragariae]|uniref:CKK domain-containing protein n=1 Tax=Phytophthora fragariae TaxID=53985 RepID=A0A6G0PKI4_9STRA|nr:hypothetical protein PF004_g3834 [Phytophthora fragariae]
MFSSTWVSSAPAASTPLQPPPDAYELAEEYGTEAATKLSHVLQALEGAGFPKAHVNSYSAFDRVLSGVTWLLQRLVRREDAEKGRVQWDVLFQSHDKMKPRLGLAQEAVRCVEALAYACPVAVQPHQLLLQDFGDIETVQKLVTWLVDEAKESQHLEKIRREREYLQVMSPEKKGESVTPLKKEVEFLLDAYAPRRRWQYVAVEGEHEETEDALIQRCLLEYGERVTVAVDEEEPLTVDTTEGGKDQVDFMAQIANQAAAIASGGASKPRGGSMRGLRRAKRGDTQAAEFDRQYQKAMKQAKEEQQALLTKRREREAKMLQRVVSAPEEKLGDIAEGQVGSVLQTPLHLVRAQLKEHEVQVQQLIQEKQQLDAKTTEANARAVALDEALSAVKQEIDELEAETPKDENAQAHLAKLRELVKKNETLKREKNEFRAKCRLELEGLKERIEKLKLQVAVDASNQDEEALRLNEIEQMHAQMAQKHKDMKLAAAKQTRALHLKMKQIDEIPTRIELVQYEKRFIELYDEVALTLDETRKYYCVYNTLKTTHEFLEKEISLINSINENFDVAMGSKTATQAFFTQIENIIQNVQGTVSKQQLARDDHQFSVETLDSKYQLLLEQERITSFEGTNIQTCPSQGDMTKKKTLSPTASLATCLDFAARVLFSTASVQEICTKPVLAPMVVEAHRYGQQATKHLEPGAPPDVRKLLKVLQSNNLDRASPLAKLDVADLTWDFEGTVADTLEMELEELKDRAAMNITDICVVFSASTPASTGGQAVIWFPLKNHQDLRDEDDRRSAIKKQQILLYVCPGRVKVVKSVGDLVKKLYDELPSIRENDASYSVWAVFKNDTRIDNQKDRQAPSTVMKDGMVSQFAVDQEMPTNTKSADHFDASGVDQGDASNRQLMQNALEFTLLAGGSMEKERAQALQALADSTCDNFIVLLKSAKELKFRALYENHVERDSATRIYSVLPNNSSRAPLKLGGSEVISQFFKYSSAKKQFLPVSTRSFTVKTDACALVEQLVFKGKSKSSRLL